MATRSAVASRHVPTDEPPADAPRPGARGALVATSLGFGVVQLDVSVVNVAVHAIGTDLHAGVDVLQWVVSAYTVAFAALILTAGSLGDRIGARRLFVAGFALFTAASVLCALSPTPAVLLTGRALQGIGAATLVPCSLTLLNHEYPDPKARGRAVGLWAAGASTALSAGPLIGGVLIATLGWRWIFLINVPVGIVGILLTLRCAVETPRSRRGGVDVPGQVGAVVALGALAASTIEGGKDGFTSAPVLGGFALAVVAAACFLLAEKHSRRPMLPLSLFRDRTFGSASLLGLLINVAIYGLLFVLSLYFQEAQHRSALVTGLLFGPMTVAVTASNLVASAVARRLGTRTTLALGCAVSAAGCAGLLVADASTSYGVLVVPLVAVGAGLGLVVPLMTAAVLGSVDRSRSGVASGTLNTARQTGSVIGVAVFGSLTAGGARLVHGLHLALAISVVLALLGLAVSTRIQAGLR